MMLRQITYFRAIVENASFTEAAKVCGISQAAMSQQIKSLEKTIGARLIDRNNRNVSLTPAGEHFYRGTLSIINELEKVTSETLRIADSTSAFLRIGYPQDYFGLDFYCALSDYASHNPDIRIDTICENHDELLDSLNNGSVDIAFGELRGQVSDPFVRVVPLVERPYYVVLPSGNPLSKLDSIEISDMKNMPYIFVTSKEHIESESAFYRNSVGLCGDFIFADSLAEARAMFATGKGAMLSTAPIGADEAVPKNSIQIPLFSSGRALTRYYCVFYRTAGERTAILEFIHSLKLHFI